MKHPKLLILVLTATVAFSVPFGTATASTVKSNGAIYTGEINGYNTSNHGSLHGSNGVTIECDVSIVGTVEKHGAAVTAEGKPTSVGISGCTSQTTVHTKQKGVIIAHAIGGGNATLTSSGTVAEATVSTFFGTITCIYETGSNLPFGTLTGSKTTGGKAIVDFSATVPRTGGSGLCGNSGVLTGQGVVDTPANLNVE